MSVSSSSSSEINVTSELIEPMQREEWMYAGFWIRVCAYFIDVFIYAALACVVFVPVVVSIALERNSGITPEEATNNHPVIAGVLGLYALIGYILLVLYFPLFNSSRFQATPGKMLFGMRVVTYDRQRIGFWRALLRYLIKVFISFPVLCIGVLMVAFTARKEGLHDLIARTVVERKVKINIMPGTSKGT